METETDLVCGVRGRGCHRHWPVWLSLCMIHVSLYSCCVDRHRPPNTTHPSIPTNAHTLHPSRATGHDAPDT